jgi:hypothetical protein
VNDGSPAVEEVSTVSAAWHGNWKSRILARLRTQGYARLTDYLRQQTAVPSIDVAELLGKDDVAALQVEWLAFEEAVEHGEFREAAIDSLLREIAYHLPGGWKKEAKGDFETAGVWAGWITRLEEYSPTVSPLARAVWNKLLAAQPPAGWKPQSAEDGLIVRAFNEAWPPGTIVETVIPQRPNAD